jgi:hypothetical protein
VYPESQVREVLLRDKFLTQLSPDIHRKLQKVVAEATKCLTSWYRCLLLYTVIGTLLEREKKTKGSMI